MPRCDTCGFAHAQADHCINCGNRDPFRRHRFFRLTSFTLLFFAVVAAGIYFYQRYVHIERSVREAQLTGEATAIPGTAPALRDSGAP
jgi:hypothetical protein